MEEEARARYERAVRGRRGGIPAPDPMTRIPTHIHSTIRLPAGSYLPSVGSENARPPKMKRGQSVAPRRQAVGRARTVSNSRGDAHRRNQSFPARRRRARGAGPRVLPSIDRVSSIKDKPASRATPPPTKKSPAKAPLALSSLPPKREDRIRVLEEHVRKHMASVKTGVPLLSKAQFYAIRKQLKIEKALKIKEDRVMDAMHPELRKDYLLEKQGIRPSPKKPAKRAPPRRRRARPDAAKRDTRPHQVARPDPFAERCSVSNKDDVAHVTLTGAGDKAKGTKDAPQKSPRYIIVNGKILRDGESAELKNGDHVSLGALCDFELRFTGGGGGQGTTEHDDMSVDILLASLLKAKAPDVEKSLSSKSRVLLQKLLAKLIVDTKSKAKARAERNIEAAMVASGSVQKQAEDEAAAAAAEAHRRKVQAAVQKLKERRAKNRARGSSEPRQRRTSAGSAQARGDGGGAAGAALGTAEKCKDTRAHDSSFDGHYSDALARSPAGGPSIGHAVLAALDQAPLLGSGERARNGSLDAKGKARRPDTTIKSPAVKGLDLSRLSLDDNVPTLQVAAGEAATKAPEDGAAAVPAKGPAVLEGRKSAAAAADTAGAETAGAASVVTDQATARKPKMRMDVEWRCKNCNKECLPIREESWCLCGHRRKDHKMVKRNGKVYFVCNSRQKCPCKNFYYIPAQGMWILRCKCKHKHTDHDPKPGKHACMRRNCKCKGYGSPWVCNCGCKWNDHKQVAVLKPVRTIADIAKGLAEQMDVKRGLEALPGGGGAA